MRITSPPVDWPCFYGIDTDTQEQLIARDAVGRGDPRAHRRGLARLPLARRDGGGDRDRWADFCLACFNGDYPIDIPETSGAASWRWRAASSPQAMELSSP